MSATPQLTIVTNTDSRPQSWNEWTTEQQTLYTTLCTERTLIQRLTQDYRTRPRGSTETTTNTAAPFDQAARTDFREVHLRLRGCVTAVNLWLVNVASIPTVPDMPWYTAAEGAQGALTALMEELDNNGPTSPATTDMLSRYIPKGDQLSASLGGVASSHFGDQ
ncbi:hypothetical protein JCM24511_06051 [Saitozyma sp. JCM 24511]|nr:hypothetical protein JCM24511_06051 [Saitozyma sp. JCM 24511]